MPLTKLSFKKDAKRRRESDDYHVDDEIEDHSSSRKERKKHKRHKSHRSKHKHYSCEPPTISDDLEQGWAPPPSSIKPDESEWNERIFDAMIDDEGQDFHSSHFNSYWQPTPDDRPTGRHNVNHMSDEEYRQYIVNGIYERTHADEIKFEKERQEKRKKAKEAKAQAQAQARQEEAKREREREATRKIRQLQKLGISRKQYQAQWEAFDNKSTTKKLRLKDIPWPIAGSEVSKIAVKDFLLYDIQDLAEQKKVIRKEQLRYHPDKFMQKISGRLVENQEEQKSISERINHISSCLNDIWSEL